jgi:hypothetical protein
MRLRLLAEMLNPKGLETLWNSLSPEMRRFYGLPPKKRGRKKDPDRFKRVMEMVRLRRCRATWPEIERAMAEKFGHRSEGTYRRQYERMLKEYRDFASKESDEEFLTILAHMSRKPGRLPKKKPDKIRA